VGRQEEQKLPGTASAAKKSRLIKNNLEQIKRRSAGRQTPPPRRAVCLFEGER